jgi:hypothetical protein
VKTLSPTSKSIRTRAFFLILVWILLFSASLGLLSFLLSSYLHNPQVQSVVSLSWAGYVAASSFSNPQPQVIGINASWTIPSINASATDVYSSAWIGIGGQFDKTLIQLGTEHDYDSNNDQVKYSAWYEMLPAYAQNIPVTISEGDNITASITMINSDTNEWNIQLIDNTNNQSFSQNVAYNSTRSSGEWIVERPTLNNQITSLASFGTITFTDAYVNINNAVYPLGHAPFAQVLMTNRQNTQLTSVSSISADGTSFTVGYSLTS